MSRWFRYYDDALDDPKVQRLSGDLFKAWVNVLSLASKSGGRLPSIDDIAFKLRISVQDAAQRIDDLILAGLIDILPDKSLTPHKWTERQYVSDSSTERMRRHRAKKGDVTVTSPPSHGDAIESESDTDTDTDTESPDLPSSLDAVRVREKNDQGGFIGSRGRGQGRQEKIIRRAEGLGVPTDELIAAVNEHKAKNRTAYFTALCVAWFAKRLPGISEQVVRDALWGTDAQYAVLLSLMAEVA